MCQGTVFFVNINLCHKPVVTNTYIKCRVPVTGVSDPDANVLADPDPGRPKLSPKKEFSCLRSVGLQASLIARIDTIDVFYLNTFLLSQKVLGWIRIEKNVWNPGTGSEINEHHSEYQLTVSYNNR
jgi:hypothetical protein